MLYIRNLTIPSFSVNTNSEGDHEVEFDKNKTVELISVGFKSLQGKPFFFYSDTNISFTAGKTNRFTLKTEEHPNIIVNSGFWSTIDPVFLSMIFTKYDGDIIVEDFEPIRVEIDKNYDNKTGRFNATLTFGEPYDFFPSNAEWHELYLVDSSHISIDRSAIYDGSGKFLGKFENNTLNRRIQEDDKLVINGKFEEKKGAIYINIRAKLYDIPECEKPDSLGVYRVYFEE